MIYLDNAATTYPKPECVYKALDKANREFAFNAGRGSYDEARQVSEIIDSTRTKIGDLINVESNKVYFESSATEALNIVINGLDLKENDTVYISPFEHNAVVRPLYNLQKKGIKVELLPFDRKTWEINETQMKNMFAINKPKACFLTHISNVTGYILPFGSIFAHTLMYNCVNILDCSQSMGVLNPNVENVDFVIFAGHKSLYASFGVAGFVNVNNKHLSITKSGGTGSDSLNVNMPEYGFARYEAGSANSVAIYGLNESLNWLKNNDVLCHEKELTNYLINELLKLTKVHLYLPNEINDICGIVSFSVDGYTSKEVGSILYDEFKICVRTGYHCAPFVHEFINSIDSLGTVRVSLGAFTTKEDIDSLINALRTF